MCISNFVTASKIRFNTYGDTHSSAHRKYPTLLALFVLAEYPQRSFDRDKRIPPEKREPQRHHAKETVSYKYFDASAYKKVLRDGDTDESKDQCKKIVPLFFDRYQPNDKQYVHSYKYVIIGDEWYESDHYEYWKHVQAD
jgi:hypothetical protein